MMFVAVLALPSIYMALLLFELVLWRRQPRSVLRTRGRGLYVVQDGYVSLTGNATGAGFPQFNTLVGHEKLTKS